MVDILIRDSATNEVLHTISVAADDERRDDIVKAVLEGFEPGSVYVDDEPQTAPTLTGDGAPRDEPAIPPFGSLPNDDDKDEDA